MARNAKSLYQIVTDDEAATESLVDRMLRFSEELSPVASWEEAVRQSKTQVAQLVEDMKALMDGQDVFDVVELVRQHETPMTLAGFRESLAEGMAAVIEIVALVALGTGPRIQGSDSDSQAVRPANEIVSELCAKAKEVVGIATILGVAVRQDPKFGPLADLASQLRISELTIRNKHYTSIGTRINEEIFDTDPIEQTVERSLGFSYRQVVEVAEAIKSKFSSSRTEILDKLGDLVVNQEPGQTPTIDVVESARQLFSDFFVNPGRSASFVATDIGELCSVPVSKVSSILDLFAMGLGQGSSLDLVNAFVDGKNPLYGIGLLRDDDNNYAILHDPIPLDHIRRTIEDRLKQHSTATWSTYSKTRDKVAERVAVRLVKSLFDVSSCYEGLKYLAPRETDAVSQLGIGANTPKETGQLVEADGLLVIGDIAVCVEVKAGSITDKARSGNVRRVATDLEKTIGGAAEQANRLERLISENHGLWLHNGKWLDLSQVREVRTIVACLDDFGPLAIAAESLIRSGLLKTPTIPWIVSIHDLMVAADLFDSPASFLLYLRRRTEPTAARLFKAVDELDVLMWFMAGGLYFEADPDELFARYPMSPPPTKRDRAVYRNQPRTRISTLTDDLDAWMYFQEGVSDLPAEKPVRVETEEIVELVDFLRSKDRPGWLRFGADLFNLSAESQQKLVRNIKTIVKATQKDHQFHSLSQGFATPWGYALLIVGTKPVGYHGAMDRLVMYMTAKKYQVRADRALGLLFDERGKVVAGNYDNVPYSFDSNIEKIVDSSGLVDPRSKRNSHQTPKWNSRKKRAKRKR